MKTILFLTLSAFSFIGTAQTVETLKKDLANSKTENQKLNDANKFLIEKLNFCNAIAADTITEIKSFSNLYSINLLSCKGDSKSQTVTIELLVSQNSTNQDLALDFLKMHGTQVVDILGKTYNIITNDYRTTIYTGIETRIQFTINNILPGTEAFSIVSVRMKTVNIGEYVDASHYTFTEIRNLKIVW